MGGAYRIDAADWSGAGGGELPNGILPEGET